MSEKEEYPMTDLIGPMVQLETFVPAVDGFKVPYLKVEKGDKGDKGYTVVLDDRIATEYLPLIEIRRWLPFIANCMAFSAGYASHGQRKKSSPFSCRVSSLGEPEPTIRLLPAPPEPEG